MPEFFDEKGVGHSTGLALDVQKGAIWESTSILIAYIALYNFDKHPSFDHFRIAVTCER